MSEVKCEHKNFLRVIKTISWCKDCGALSDGDRVCWRLPELPSARVALDEFEIADLIESELKSSGYKRPLMNGIEPVNEWVSERIARRIVSKYGRGCGK